MKIIIYWHLGYKYTWKNVHLCIKNNPQFINVCPEDKKAYQYWRQDKT